MFDYIKYYLDQGTITAEEAQRIKEALEKLVAAEVWTKQQAEKLNYTKILLLKSLSIWQLVKELGGNGTLSFDDALKLNTYQIEILELPIVTLEQIILFNREQALVFADTAIGELLYNKYLSLERMLTVKQEQTYALKEANIRCLLKEFGGSGYLTLKQVLSLSLGQMFRLCSTDVFKPILKAYGGKDILSLTDFLDLTSEQFLALDHKDIISIIAKKPWFLEYALLLPDNETAKWNLLYQDGVRNRLAELGGTGELTLMQAYDMSPKHASLLTFADNCGVKVNAEKILNDEITHADIARIAYEKYKSEHSKPEYSKPEDSKLVQKLVLLSGGLKPRPISMIEEVAEDVKSSKGVGMDDRLVARSRLGL